jgi:hypothetical protein
MRRRPQWAVASAASQAGLTLTSRPPQLGQIRSADMVCKEVEGGK